MIRTSSTPTDGTPSSSGQKKTRVPFVSKKPARMVCSLPSISSPTIPPSSRERCSVLINLLACQIFDRPALPLLDDQLAYNF
jgi:hypothetical protein